MKNLEELKQKIIKLSKIKGECKNGKFLDKDGNEIKDLLTPIEKIVGDIEFNINLEDVLITYNKKNKIDSGNNYMAHDQVELFRILRLWQLNKPLHEQEEKTINFLHKILC